MSNRKNNSSNWRPENPHPLSRLKTELVWEGKYDEYGNRRPVKLPSSPLPLQRIETIDEPRDREKAKQGSMFNLEGFIKKAHRDDFRNLLIWGDNKLAVAALLEQFRGKVDLIYIDPPFDVGADFTMQVQLGEEGEVVQKEQSIIEAVAYRDTWGRGTDSYLHMMYERLTLMRDLLSERGSIYVHCDWRLNSYIRIILQEIFGFYRNEIVWQRTTNTGSSKGIANKLSNDTDSIFYFSKSDNPIFNKQYRPYSEDYLSRFKYEDEKGKFRWQYMATYSDKKLKELEALGMIRWAEGSKNPEYKQYMDSLKGIPLNNLWDDIFHINPMALENLSYPTQKPEELLERIIKISSNEGDLVADPFGGSGTMAAVAEKSGRKWIVADLGKFAIHTTRKRMIGVQRLLKKEGKPYRAFEILNLGKYERQHYIGVNPNLREEEKQKQLEEKEKGFLELILRAYRAEKVEGFRTFHGKKAGRLVAVGPVNLPVTRLFVEEVILECRQKHITKVDILAFEFEMGLFPNVLDEARAKGIDIVPKYIPAEVFDKRAVEKNQVVFHDVAFVEVKPLVKGNSVAMQLTDFSVFYSQDSIAYAEATLKDKASKIVVEKGQIVKVSKNKDGIVSREVLTQHWTDWVDYWAVDFDFENKREIIRVKNAENGEWEEVWTGDYIFENEWQSFRTRKDRTLELQSVFHECLPGRRKLAVKVVDIFGNDTMKVIEVNVGGKR